MRKLLLTMLLLTLANRLPGQTPEAPAPLLEAGFNGPATAATAPGWGTDAWDLKNGATARSVARFSLDAEAPAEGEHCQKVETLSPDGWPALFAYAGLGKGTSYRLSFAFRQHGIPGSVRLLFRPNLKDQPLFLTDGTGDAHGLRLLAGSDWKRFSFAFTAGCDAPRAQLIFLNTVGQGTFWVDDLRLRAEPPAPPVPNLLGNGSFEAPNVSCTTGRDWLVDAWNLKGEATPASVALFAIDHVNPAQGNYAQQVILLNGDGWPAVFAKVALRQGTAYRLSFALRQQGLLPGVHLLFRPSVKGGTRFLDPNGDYRGINLKPGEDWARYTYEFVAYGDDPQAQLIFMNCGNPGIFWVDDVCLTPIPAPAQEAQP